MSLPRNSVTKALIPHLPAKVALADVKQVVTEADGSTRLFILSEADRKQILKSLRPKPDGRYSKSKKGDPNYHLTVKSDYSVIKYEGRCYAVYKGVQKDSAAGAGSSGIVKHIQDIETGEWRVVKNFSQVHLRRKGVKIAYQNSLELKKDAEAEFEQIKKIQLAPKSKLLFRKTANKQEQYIIVMDEVRGRDLSELSLKQIDLSSLTPRRWLNLFLSMATSVHDLHQKKLLHRDIKPANFLYDFKQAKLIDLNLSIEMSNEKYGSVYQADGIGTPLTVANEIINLGISRYSTKSDAFALGVSIAMMLNLIILPPPFPTRLHADSNKAFILNPYIQDKMLLRKILAICEGLMEIDVDKRLSAAEAIQRFTTLISEYKEKLKIGLIDLAEFNVNNIRPTDIPSLASFDEIILIDTRVNSSYEDSVNLKRHLEKYNLNVRNELYTGETKEAIVAQIERDQAPVPLHVIKLFSNRGIEADLRNTWPLVKNEIDEISAVVRFESGNLDKKRTLIREKWANLDALFGVFTTKLKQVNFQVSGGTPKTRATGQPEGQDKGKSRAITKKITTESLSEEHQEKILLDSAIPEKLPLRPEALHRLKEEEPSLVNASQPNELAPQLAALTHQINKLGKISNKLSATFWQPLKVNLLDVHAYLTRSDKTLAEKQAYLRLKQSFLVAITKELIFDAETKLHLRVSSRLAKPIHVADPEQDFFNTWLKIESLIADTDDFIKDQRQPIERKQAYLINNLQQLKVLKAQLLTGKLQSREAKFLPEELQQQKLSIDQGVQAAKTIAKCLREIEKRLMAAMPLEANGRLAIENMDRPVRQDLLARRIHPLELQVDFTQLSNYLAMLEIYQRRYHDVHYPTPQLNALVQQLRDLREALLNNEMPIPDKLALFINMDKKLRLASIETQKITLPNYPTVLWLQDMKVGIRVTMTNLTKTLQPAGIPIQSAPASPLAIQTINRLKAPLQEYATQLRKQKHPNLRRARMTLELIQKLEDLIMVLARNNPDLIQDRMTKVTLLIDKLYREGDLKEHRHFNFLKQAIGRKTKLEVMVENIDAVIRPLNPVAPVAERLTSPRRARGLFSGDLPQTKGKGRSKEGSDKVHEPLLPKGKKNQT